MGWREGEGWRTCISTGVDSLMFFFLLSFSLCLDNIQIFFLPYIITIAVLRHTSSGSLSPWGHYNDIYTVSILYYLYLTVCILYYLYLYFIYIILSISTLYVSCTISIYTIYILYYLYLHYMYLVLSLSTLSISCTISIYTIYILYYLYLHYLYLVLSLSTLYVSCTISLRTPG